MPRRRDPCGVPSSAAAEFQECSLRSGIPQHRRRCHRENLEEEESLEAGGLCLQMSLPFHSETQAFFLPRQVRYQSTPLGRHHSSPLTLRI